MQSDSHNESRLGRTRASILRPTRALVVGAIAVVALLSTAAFLLRLRSNPHVTIGVEGQRQVDIPGELLTAAPFTPGDAVSLRIAHVEPTPTGHRYDLRFIAYGPGEHDLATRFVTAANKPAAAVPQLKINVPTILPTDHAGELFDTASSPVDLHSRYSLWMGLSWLAWLGIMLPLFLWGRKPRPKFVPPPRTPTVAERLAELLKQATTATLLPAQQAELEQLLLGYWSGRLNVSAERFAQTLGELKKHPQAGTQIALVERWLHSRQSTTEANLAEQLWQHLAADLTAVGRSSRGGAAR